MEMKRCMLGAAGALYLFLGPVASAAPYADGARVTIFGDSLTHHAYYTTPIQAFYYTRYPGRDVRIWDCGIGGASTPEAKYALEIDVKAKRPTDIVFQFGQNDSCAGGCRTNAAPAIVDCTKRAFGNFTKNTRDLRDLVRKEIPGAKLAWSSVIPHDGDLHFKGKPFIPCVGLEEHEARFAEFMRGFCQTNGDHFINYYYESLAYNKKLKEKDVFASLFPDWTHPKEAGGLFMARIFLKSQGADAVVSDIALDAAGAKAVRAANAEVRGLTRTADGGLAFVAEEKALPFPVLEKAREVADDIGFDDEMNREMLTVGGLAAGDWTLKIDGRRALTRTAGEWAKGVNLARCAETPMMAQARKVLELVQKRADVERDVRKMFVVRMVAFRILICDANFKFTYEDFSDERFPMAFERGYLRKRKVESYDWDKYYVENWKNRGKMEKRIEDLHLEIRKANRPVAHRYELVREGAAPALASLAESVFHDN